LSDKEVNELAVNPHGRPIRSSVVTIVTPVGNFASAFTNVSGSMQVMKAIRDSPTATESDKVNPAVALTVLE